MTRLRVALVAACAAVLLGWPAVAEDPAAETAATQDTVSPVPAKIPVPLPPPLPPGKTVAVIDG